MRAGGADGLANYQEQAVALVHDPYTRHAEEKRTHWSAEEHEEQICFVPVLPICVWVPRTICVHVIVQFKGDRIRLIVLHHVVCDDAYHMIVAVTL